MAQGAQPGALGQPGGVRGEEGPRGRGPVWTYG